MPLTKLRRPKYTKKDIKQQYFSVALSRNRIFKVQNLLKKENCDAFIIILGIDSRFNKGCDEAANYLLFDCFTTRKDDIERSKADEDVFEDLVICVKSNSVDVYCNGVNYWLLMPYITHWPNLRMHIITEQMMDSNMDTEDVKINTFIQMVNNWSSVAIPYRASFEKVDPKFKFDNMLVEQWPLVQSYAFDDFGTGSRGFFSLKHKIVDVSTEFHKLIYQVDPVKLETLMNKFLPQFECLFENVFQVIDMSISNVTTDWSSKMFYEPLKSYYDHGKLSGTNRTLNLQPFILFGTGTNQSNYSAAISGKKVKSFDSAIEFPTHFVVLGCTAPNDLVCMRTFFFDGTSNIDWNRTVNTGSESRRDDVRILVRLYKALVNSIGDTLKWIAQGVTIDKSISEAKRILQKTVDASYGNINIEILSFDKEDLNFSNHPSTVIIKAEIVDITNAGRKLGSVAYADTVTVCIVKQKAGVIRGDYALITGNIAQYICWSKLELSAIHHHVESSCGRVIETAPVKVIGQDKDFKQIQVHASFYERHILLYSKRHGASLVNIKSLRYKDAESIEDPTLLFIEYSDPEFVSTIFRELVNSETSKLMICLESGSKAKKLFYSQMLSVWRGVDLLKPIEVMSTSEQMAYTSCLPTESASQTIIVGSKGDASNSNSKNVNFSFLGPEFAALKSQSGIQTFISRLPKFKTFLKELETACCLNGRTEDEWSGIHDRIKKILETNQVKKVANDVESPFTPIVLEDEEEVSEIVLTVVCGLPGSGSTALCSSLMQLVREDTRWIYLRPDNLNSLAQLLNQALLNTNKVQKRPVPGQSRKRLRCLICCPGLTGAKQIQECIRGMNHVKIGSVTTCVDTRSIFMDKFKKSFPHILELCSEGWCNNVVFTGQDTPQQGMDLDEGHLLVKSVNPKANMVTILDGEIKRTQEIDLLMDEDAFETEQLFRTRMLSASPQEKVTLFDAEFLKQCDPPLHVVRLTFNKSIDKNRFINQLKSLRGSLKRWPYAGNMYFLEGKLKFTQDAAHLYEFNHSSLSGITRLQIAHKLSTNNGAVTKTPQPPGSTNRSTSGDQDQCVVTVLGCQLNEQEIKEWLQKAVRQPPKSKPLLERKSLTQAQIDEIHKKRHFEALPEGWFYTGTTFVCMDGSRSQTHPDLEKFLEDYIVEENKKIAEFNRRVESLPRVQLFE